MRKKTPDTREIWQIVALIEASPEQAAQARDAVGRALCPDEHHDGYCPVPWTTILVRFADLGKKERASWQQSFAEEREAAGQAGQAGAQEPSP